MVPDPRLGFIGAGRLATTLAMAFQRAGCTVTVAASRSPASAAKLASRVPGCVAVDRVDDVPAQADIVFVTTNDDAIGPAAASVRWRAGIGVVHCSGATDVAKLAPAAAAGALTGGFHPLATFGDPDAALANLPGCTVALEAPAPLLATLRDLAGRLGCRAIELPAGARGVYHASGGFASQFVHVLIEEAATLWGTFGVAHDDAVRALLPLLKSTVAAIERVGPVQGMPGPVSRGDLGTVERHLANLAPLGGEHADFYRRLARRTVEMALERGGIDAARAQAFRDLLA